MAQPETWDEEDALIPYPYNDHCYFKIELARTIPNDEENTPRMHSTRDPFSPYGTVKGTDSFNDGGITAMEDDLNTFGQTTDDILTTSIRIGPGGVLSTNKKQPQLTKQRRKQKLENRSNKLELDMSSGGRGFMSLMPGSGYLGNTSSMDMQFGVPGTSQDMQEEIIEQELIREVTEIAEKDPVLQDLINSMQQTAGQGIS